MFVGVIRKRVITAERRAAAAAAAGDVAVKIYKRHPSPTPQPYPKLLIAR